MFALKGFAIRGRKDKYQFSYNSLWDVV